MIAAWMLYGLVISTGLAVAGVLLERGCRSIGVPTRALWLGLMVACVVMMGAAIRFVAPVAPPLEGGAGVPTAPGAIGVALPGTSLPVAGAPARRSASSVEPAGLDRPLLLFWAALTISVATVLVDAACRLARRRRAWRPVIVDGVPVLLTDGAGPAVVGLIDRRVILPEWVCSLPPSQRRLVLEHELQHLRACDPLAMVAGHAIAALLPWSPIVWYMVRRLRLAIEMDCDRRVLRTTSRAHDYAALLLDLSGRATAESWLAPAMVERTTDVERRVVAIVADHGRRIEHHGGALSLAGALLLIVACVAPRPTISVPAPRAVGGTPPELSPLTVDSTLVATLLRRSGEGATTVRGAAVGSGRAFGGVAARGSTARAGSAIGGVVTGTRVATASGLGGGTGAARRLPGVATGVATGAVAAVGAARGSGWSWRSDSLPRRAPAVQVMPSSRDVQRMIPVAFPELFDDRVTADSAAAIVVLFALDSLGTATHRRIIPRDATQSRDVLAILRSAFPELATRAPIGGGTATGTVAATGRSPRRLTVLWGVFVEP